LNEAIGLYKLLADDGDSVGCFHCALCVQYGRGIDADLDEACCYYEQLSGYGGRREDDRFRCLRVLGRAEFESRQFPGLRDEPFEILQECRTSRPSSTRTSLADFLIDRDAGTTSIRQLGSGGSSTIELVRNGKDEGYVIKYLSLNTDQSIFLREAETLSNLNHVCVVRLLGCVLTDGGHRAEIHLEYAAHGSLDTILREVRQNRRPKFWTATTISIVISGIVLGLRYIHSKGFIHQDLKPSNILISDQCRTLIADFGAARASATDATPDGVTGTVNYAAPEQLEETFPITKIDVFSFGLIVYEILVGLKVFPVSEPPFSILKKLRSGYVPMIPDSVFPWIRDLILSCLSSAPDDRPSFDEILVTLRTNDFNISEGIDRSSVRCYVEGVVEWEHEQTL
jgi:serine/threonine protein kinase